MLDADNSHSQLVIRPAAGAWQRAPEVVRLGTDLRRRLQPGWPVEKLTTTPTGGNNPAGGAQGALRTLVPRNTGATVTPRSSRAS